MDGRLQKTPPHTPIFKCPLLWFFFSTFFGCVHVAYGILVPWPGSVPGPGSDSAES